MANRQEGPALYKVVLLGDSYVGKTSLISKKVHGKAPGSSKPTLGCHCSQLSVTVGQKQITLQVWDTAGQEMYRALVPVYLRDVHFVFLLFDISKPESFDSLAGWCALLDDLLPEYTPMFVVANKMDLADQFQFNENEAVEFARAHRAKFYKVSALTGDGVAALFNDAAEEIAKLNVNRINTHLIRPGREATCAC
jgi:small GTP-binding protein